MYYIYHIPNVKIGCTSNPKKRIEENQGYTDYEILEEHTCIDTASKREIELQKKYGYRVDNRFYKDVIDAASISLTKQWKTNRERMLKTNKRNGKIQGKKNLQSGHWNNISKLGILSRIRPILQYDVNGNFIKEWESAAEVSKFMNITNGSAVTAVCKGKRKTAYGFIWKYKENN